MHALGAAPATLLLGQLGCHAPQPRPAVSPPASGSTASKPIAGEQAPFSLAEKSFVQLQALMDAGTETARSLVEAYRGRIDAIDQRGPTLRAVLQLNPEALHRAEQLDDERRARGPRGPLHGIPLLLKDNIATTGPLDTTAGSLALVGTRPAEEAFVVTQLRDAGAVLLGKSNLSEWANFRSSFAASGWSSRGGQCANPYELSRSPCGSSSGSAAATAANLVSAALGTETNGSIVCPASTCGIVGHKPTVGLVSRSGIVPISHVQDTAGPMTRTVRDAATLLQVMAGPDPRDAATATATAGDYLSPLRADALHGARIGVARKMMDFHPGVDTVIDAALADLEKAGATVIDVDLNFPPDLYGDALEVLLYEFKAEIERYLATLLGPAGTPRSLADLIAYNEAHRDTVMPYFDQDLFVKAQSKGSLDSSAYREARERLHRATRSDGIDRVMAEHRLDAIAAATGSPAWKTDLINGDHYLGGSSTVPAIAGYPHITVPAGQVHGLPVGLSLFAEAHSDGRLLALAYAYEQATSHRQPPALLRNGNGSG